MNFETRYQKLNDKQRKAVDTIDGPVMVIAGPGTGKTELLGMRAANILQKTDTLPENILCLTFTDSGAHAMRQRLASIIGKDAYKVAIHTFHSFGSEIINQYGEYFYQGAQFRPADELSTYQIIRGILDELEYSNPLASKMNGEYTHLRDIISTISDLKRSGLTSDELLQILDANDAVLDAVEPSLTEVFSHRISATTLAQLTPVAHTVASLDSPSLPGGITPLSNVLSLSIAHAIDEATALDSTKPITAWKNKWLTKDTAGSIIFKDRARQSKLRAVSYIYFQYLSHMQEAGLYDYDDMILRVVHAMEVFGELRLALQERYQYIMVDEFQDTNLAQMRILINLTDNPVNEGMPNILVVGDDDQAIYSFQGADIGNILTFQTEYPKAMLIPLIDNYRSGDSILTAARSVITQGDDRLEQHIETLDKTLIPHTSSEATVDLYEATTVADERQWIVESIVAQIEQGTAPGDIAVLARRHHEIIELLPFFAHSNIPVNYERRDNVFDIPSIRLLILLSRSITLLMQQRLDDADRLLPELFAHPAWGIEREQLWKLSIAAYDGRRRWLDTMATLPYFQPLYTWLIDCQTAAWTTPLEYTIDTLIGTPIYTDEQAGTYRSPLYEYFFSAERLQESPLLYLQHLEALRTIRQALREYKSDTEPTLVTFVEFVALYQQTGSTLVSVHRPADQSDAVHLMTAHKSKGLEYDTVYVTGAVESSWGARVRTRQRLIAYPENLPLAAAGDSANERIRLFFVAMTRAKRHLRLSYATVNDAGKSLDRAGFLLTLEHTVIDGQTTSEESIGQATREWYAPVIDPPRTSLDLLLAPLLQSYKLSATHLGNFLDITRGGPSAFLIHTLLRFPQAMSPAAAYGSAAHLALQHAHAHLAATGKHRAVEDILRDYETALADNHLTPTDLEHYTQKGVASLQAFLDAKYATFSPSQKVELNFAGQQSIVDGAHLTGKIDLVDIDTANKTVVVTDYKTGHPSQSWKGTTDYEKIKLHRYRQQLLFYKLLVEHSRDYHTYSVTHGVLQFIEPTKSGEIVALEEDVSAAELNDFRRLIIKVWEMITHLNFPDTSQYEQNYKGLLAFEQDILDEKI